MTTFIMAIPESRTHFPARFLITIAASLLLLGVNANGQTSKRSIAAAAAAEEEAALFRDYRGVQLGMTADDVRKKLGAPKDKSDDQDFYIFNETETAQVVYDKEHKVITISADFLQAGTTVPTPKQVFGSEVEAKADGSVYKMMRFPKSGYWLSFSRTGGAAPLTTVTLQKIQ
ncbi:MAG: hypothetical protein QOD33_155 [Pyrinomonadaceae bacterium]|nr:hypothetical protein [Pyrinomonadaceae bacterium]